MANLFLGRTFNANSVNLVFRIFNVQRRKIKTIQRLRSRRPLRRRFVAGEQPFGDQARQNATLHTQPATKSGK